MDMETKFFIELVENNGMRYYQLVRKADDAILAASLYKNILYDYLTEIGYNFQTIELKVSL